MSLVAEWQRAIGVTPDGDFGPKTLAASMALLKPAPAHPQLLGTAWPRQKDVAAFFGPAGGADCTAGSVTLPFAFPLAWDESQRVARFAVLGNLGQAN